MSDKTEWEVLDAPSPGEQARDPRQGLSHLLRQLLGPYWKWKIAGAAAIGGLALAVLIALTGVVLVTLTAVAVLSIVVAAVRGWLRGGRNSKRDVSMRTR
jgi:apolipoprotein N-acyltransferase